MSVPASHPAPLDSEPKRRLRVLAADEDLSALDEIEGVLDDLGHDVAAFAVEARDAAIKIADIEPDVAIVRVHQDEEHALDLIAEIGAFASGPVIAALDSEDPGFVAAAAERGIYAYARPVTPATVQSAIEVAVRRHAETEQLSERVDQLETALERRTAIERAKGILMERHSIDDRAAFVRLRDHARAHNRRVVDVARAVSDGHALLPRNEPEPGVARSDGAAAG